MNREIKYRFWHNEKKEMFDVEAIFFEPTHYFNDIRCNGEDYNLSEGSLIEYTGLKDRNGVDIYEGDIVNPVSEITSPTPCQVEFEKGAFILVSNWIFNDHMTFIEVDEDELELEIIGNIFENPGLLEG